MEQIGISLIEKLDGWYIELMIPVLIGIGIWLLTHLRRDKQGKLYLYRESYEKKKTQKKLDDSAKKLDMIVEDSGRNRLGIMRLEILNLIQHAPDQDIKIRELYEKYREIGGNSYLADIYRKWETRGAKE
jgi:hypothetical protein